MSHTWQLAHSAWLGISGRRGCLLLDGVRRRGGVCGWSRLYWSSRGTPTTTNSASILTIRTQLSFRPRWPSSRRAIMHRTTVPAPRRARTVVDGQVVEYLVRHSTSAQGLRVRVGPRGVEVICPADRSD